MHGVAGEERIDAAIEKSLVQVFEHEGDVLLAERLVRLGEIGRSTLLL